MNQLFIGRIVACNVWHSEHGQCLYVSQMIHDPAFTMVFPGRFWCIDRGFSGGLRETRCLDRGMDCNPLPAKFMKLTRLIIHMTCLCVEYRGDICYLSYVRQIGDCPHNNRIALSVSICVTTVTNLRIYYYPSLSILTLQYLYHLVSTLPFSTSII